MGQGTPMFRQFNGSGSFVKGEVAADNDLHLVASAC